MKKLFISIELLILLTSELMGQPNICQNLPVGYQVGGDFEILVTNNGITNKSNYLCLSERADDARISVIDKSNLSNIRYMFGIDNTTTSLPSAPPLITYRDVSGDNAGEFWIIQWGEDNGQKKLNCQKVQIDVSSRPHVEISGCNDQDLTLTVKTNEPVTYYTINWNEGNTIQKVDYKSSGVVLQHSFTNQPIENITVTAVYENKNLQQTCGSVEIPVVPPSIFQITTLETQNMGSQMSAILKIRNSERKIVNLLYSEDDGLSYKTAFLTNLGTATISNLPKKVICFKIQNRENANCLYETDPVCSIYPEADNSSYGQINLRWNTSGTQTDYTIKRLGGISISKTTNQTTYIDKEIDCNGNYGYQIIGNYKNKQSMEIKVISSFVRSEANFTPTLQAKQGLVVTIMPDNHPKLEILDVTGSLTYLLYRSQGSSTQNFTKISEIKTNSYTDMVDASKDKYCYKIRHEDACGYVSPFSETICSIFLESQDETLLWNTPTESPNIRINYDVNRLNPKTTIANQIITRYKVNNPQAQIEKYQIEANLNLNINGREYKTKSLSNEVELNFETQILLPDAFTPNGDGINDEFIVFGKLEKLKSFYIQIFNRWGNIVYESDNWKKGWDGQINGEKVEVGVYMYQIKYINIFGNEQKKRGVFSLIR